jgi:hypothetical protein
VLGAVKGQGVFDVVSPRSPFRGRYCKINALREDFQLILDPVRKVFSDFEEGVKLMGGEAEMLPGISAASNISCFSCLLKLQ